MKKSMTNAQNNDWCYCNLNVSVTNDDMQSVYAIDDLIKTLVDPDDNADLSFFSHVEIPKILIDNCYLLDHKVEEKNVKETGYKHLHAFTIKEWGCTMDAKNPKLVDQDVDFVNYEFETRSTPPVAWLASISSLYPDLMFEMDCVNEMDLWEEFSVSYMGGNEIVHSYKKKQKKQKSSKN